jgi:hypothetical protein
MTYPPMARSYADELPCPALAVAPSWVGQRSYPLDGKMASLQGGRPDVDFGFTVSVSDREKQIGGLGGSLEPPGPLS